ncbi:unnamed protein product [Arabidopsis halleri]
MLETIRRMAMVRIAKRSVESHTHTGACTPYVAKFLAGEHKLASTAKVSTSTNATIPSPHQQLFGTPTTLPLPRGPVEPVELDDRLLIFKLKFGFSKRNRILGFLSFEFGDFEFGNWGFFVWLRQWVGMSGYNKETGLFFGLVTAHT